MTEFWRAAFIRAIKTVCQVLASTVPAGFAITPMMIKTFNIGYVYVVLAWLGTGLLGGFFSIITSIATGLPEVELEETLENEEFGDEDELIEDPYEGEETEDELEED